MSAIRSAEFCGFLLEMDPENIHFLCSYIST